jgi:hypothetical protein
MEETMSTILDYNVILIATIVWTGYTILAFYAREEVARRRTIIKAEMMKPVRPKYLEQITVYTRPKQ